MSRLPGWEKWASRPWYVFAVIAVLVAIILIPGHTTSGQVVGAGVFLVLVAGAAGLVAWILDARQFDTKVERVASEHHPIVSKRWIEDTHPMKKRYYWTWEARCTCSNWSYSGDEKTVREEARKHERLDYAVFKVPRRRS
jgi:hypothetical protein